MMLTMPDDYKKVILWCVKILWTLGFSGLYFRHKMNGLVRHYCKQENSLSIHESQKTSVYPRMYH